MANKKDPKDLKKERLTVSISEETFKKIHSLKPEYENMPTFLRKTLSEALNITIK